MILSVANRPACNAPRCLPRSLPSYANGVPTRPQWSFPKLNAKQDAISLSERLCRQRPVGQDSHRRACPSCHEPFCDDMSGMGDIPTLLPDACAGSAPWARIRAGAPARVGDGPCRDNMSGVGDIPTLSNRVPHGSAADFRSGLRESSALGKFGTTRFARSTEGGNHSAPVGNAGPTRRSRCTSASVVTPASAFSSASARKRLWLRNLRLCRTSRSVAPSSRRW